jgi:hypothetical protein
VLGIIALQKEAEEKNKKEGGHIYEAKIRIKLTNINT